MTKELYDGRVILVDHPLVQHKLSILRDKETSCKQFRELVREVALFEGYEATRDLPLQEVDIETPIAPMKAAQVAGKKLAVIPILRAGLGLVDGILDLMPAARVGHLGMYRNEETHQPVAYFDKMPADITDRMCMVVDPMLATGGSAKMAVEYLRGRGVEGTIKCVFLVAVPEGIEALLDADDDVQIYVAAIDEYLNEDAYIVPGLGDAGDRIFGTK